MNLIQRHIPKQILIPFAVAILLTVSCGRPPKGEADAGLGKVYFFKDGFIAVDTSRTPSGFHVWEIDLSIVDQVFLTEDGLQISSENKALDSMGFKNSHVTYSHPDAGTVMVFTTDTDGRIAGKPVKMDTGPIQTFINNGDWSRSVREVIDND